MDPSSAIEIGRTYRHRPDGRLVKVYRQWPENLNCSVDWLDGKGGFVNIAPGDLEGPLPAGQASPADPEPPGPCLWADRLTFDPLVSDESPVVRGTWVTAAQVVSHVVDGMTWGDILRHHPELTEDDIRACVAYSLAKDMGESPTIPGRPSPAEPFPDPVTDAALANHPAVAELIRKAAHKAVNDYVCRMAGRRDEGEAAGAEDDDCDCDDFATITPSPTTIDLAGMLAGLFAGLPPGTSLAFTVTTPGGAKVGGDAAADAGS